MTLQEYLDQKVGKPLNTGEVKLKEGEYHIVLTERRTGQPVRRYAKIAAYKNIQYLIDEKTGNLLTCDIFGYARSVSVFQIPKDKCLPSSSESPQPSRGAQKNSSGSKLDQEFNNLRNIEKKIEEAQAKGDEATAIAWKEAAGTTLDRMQTHFANIGKPKTVLGQLVENNLYLPG